MSAFCEARNLPGFAHWFRIQADEERSHAMRVYGHVVDRGGRVVLAGVDAPPSDFDSVLAAFEGALAHEREVTRMIDAIYATSVEERDYASQVFLQWFVQEQVEEEKQAGELVQMLSTLGDDAASLLMLDRELRGRAPEPAGGSD
jgi:ferritin